jgi:hypothetical protein
LAANLSSGGGTATSSGTTDIASPAEVESLVLYELLNTPEFDLAVARGSQLPAFLESGGGPGGFSPSALLSSDGAVPAGVAVDDAAGFVGLHVSGYPVGPQIMLVSYTGPSPTVARSALRSLIRQLAVAAKEFGAGIQRTVASFYRNSLVSASSLVANSQGALTDYARAHPEADGTNDANYRALSKQVQQADSQLVAVQAAGAANADTEGVGSSATVEVIDSPSLPRGPVTGLRAKLAGPIAGAFVGVLVALLALLALTPRPPVRWDAEMPKIAQFSVSARRRRKTPPASPGAANLRR